MSYPSYGQFSQYAPRQENCPLHPSSFAIGYCKRCNRPACPECAVQTEVGILCRECHQKNQRAQRRYSAFGGAISGKTAEYPVVWTLMGLNVLIWVLCLFMRAELYNAFAYSPLLGGQIWRLVTAGFLHSGFFHLLFNMLMLFFMGPLLERTMGHWRFACLYLLSAIGGNLFVSLWALIVPSSALVTVVGASGALYGILGAMVVSLRQLNLPSTSLMVLIGINLLYGFLMPNVSWQAHVGGLLFGAITAGGLIWSAKQGKSRGGKVGNYAVTVIIGILIVELALGWFTYQMLPF